MSKQTINIGASPNDGTGTPLRTSFDYTNQNFTELYTALGGGVGLPGATTQVIFNDGGTNLAGDAGLVYNKTTDALTVGGNVQAASATITGDLTVKTNVLKVDTTNNRVGVVNASPAYPLDVTGIINSSSDVYAQGGRLALYRSAGSSYFDWSTSQDLVWRQVTSVGGAGASTLMTLNANGLGVGASPLGKFDVYNTGADTTTFIRSDTTRLGQIVFRDNADSANQGRVKYDHSTDTLSLYSGGNENVFLSSSGNVGIGVTPSAWGANYKAFQIGAQSCLYNALGYITSLNTNAYENSSGQIVRIANGEGTRYVQAGGSHQWFYAANASAGTIGGFTQAMTLDASGNLLVGTTSSLPSFANGRIEVLSASSSYCMVADATATSAAGIGVRGNDSTVAASFYNASTGGTVGSIVINSGGVSYNTTSDYRLKESVKPISGGLARVNALKPSVYKWKSDGSNGEGFLAHELAEVVPFAVSGEKDAVNEDGSIKSQGIDMSRVVPILVAAIQELTARVQTLETH